MDNKVDKAFEKYWNDNSAKLDGQAWFDICKQAYAAGQEDRDKEIEALEDEVENLEKEGQRWAHTAQYRKSQALQAKNEELGRIVEHNAAISVRLGNDKQHLQSKLDKAVEIAEFAVRILQDGIQWKDITRSKGAGTIGRAKLVKDELEQFLKDCKGE